MVDALEDLILADADSPRRRSLTGEVGRRVLFGVLDPVLLCATATMCETCSRDALATGNLVFGAGAVLFLVLSIGGGTAIVMRVARWAQFAERLLEPTAGLPRSFGRAVRARGYVAGVAALSIIGLMLAVVLASHLPGPEPGDAWLASARGHVLFLLSYGVALSAAVFWFALVGRARLLDREQRPVGTLRTIPDLPKTHPPRAALVVHLSDTHVVSDDDGATIEGRPGANRALADVLRVARQNGTIAAADFVLISGDLTDAGRPAEWSRFLALLGNDIVSKAVVIPGNHDINIPSDGRWDAVEDESEVGRSLRLIRMMAVLDRIQGNRATVLDPSARSGRVMLHAYLARHAPALRSFAECPPWDRVAPNYERAGTTDYADLPSAVWEGLWPMFVPVHGGRAELVLIDTTTTGSSLLDNAWGALPEPILERLRVGLSLEESRGKAHIVVLHHAIALPETGGPHAQVKSAFMSMHDPERLLEAFPPDRSLLVFHGHHHVAHMGALRNATIISAPSTSHGDERESTPAAGFFAFGLDVAATGASVVSAEWTGLGRDPWRVARP
ncbi:MAG: metallophosphoesterase [Deltaproteobacteria bacterium]|nr:metallophosphoesterase [Deltaproteobacteria bacterium]